MRLMEAKFAKGSTVVYGSNGICIVDDIKAMSFGGETEMYYVLKPVSKRGATLYVPFSKEKLVNKMRQVLDKEEIDHILEGEDRYEIPWPDIRNERNELFASVITDADTRKLLALIRCIYQRKQQRLDAGKALSSGDEIALKTAEKLIEEEFAFALGCKPSEVRKYIKSKTII